VVLVVDMPRAPDRAAAAAGREEEARQHWQTLCSGDFRLVASGARVQAHTAALAFVPVAEATRRGRGGAVAGQVPAAEPTTPRRALLPNTCPLQLHSSVLSHILSSTSGYVALFYIRK